MPKMTNQSEFTLGYINQCLPELPHSFLPITQHKNEVTFLDLGPCARHAWSVRVPHDGPPKMLTNRSSCSFAHVTQELMHGVYMQCSLC